MIDAIKQALEALENTARSATEQYVAEQKAITTLRQAIEQAEKQEPSDRRIKVKIGNQFGSYLNGNWFYLHPADEFADDALAKHSGISAPPKREWVGLTDEEIMDVWPRDTRLEFVRIIEAKLRERNT
jgi:hypothetical protein